MNFIEKWIARLMAKRYAVKIKEAVMLSGMKTYIVAAAFILYGVGGYLAGIHDTDTMINRILEGLAFAGLRAGVAKVIK